MCRAKRIALKCMALIFLAASLCQAASAIELSPRASLFLDNYGADIYEGSSTGSVRIDFTVVATRHSDLVGVSQIIIYNSDGSRAATIVGSVANGLLCKDTLYHMSHYTYYGESGKSYYAKLTVYAERSGGCDTRTILTRTVTAP